MPLLVLQVDSNERQSIGEPSLYVAFGLIVEVILVFPSTVSCLTSGRESWVYTAEPSAVKVIRIGLYQRHAVRV